MLSDDDLALKKQVLQLRSANLRLQLRQQTRGAFAPVTQTVDRVRNATGWVTQRPWLVGAAAVALMVWQPARVLQVAGRGLWLWQVLQRLPLGRKGSSDPGPSP